MGGASLFLLIWPAFPDGSPVSVPRCPDGMVMATPCTPSSDLKCVHQESGTRASGEALDPGEPVTMNLQPPTASSPSSSNSLLAAGIAVLLVVVPLAVVIACCLCKCKVQGEVPGRKGEARAPPPSPQSSWCPGLALILVPRIPLHLPPPLLLRGPGSPQSHISADGPLVPMATEKGARSALHAFRAPSHGREVVSTSLG